MIYYLLTFITIYINCNTNIQVNQFDPHFKNNNIIYKNTLYNNKNQKEKNIYERIKKIYVINLKKRIDRKQEISKLLSQNFPKKNVEYFNAITKKNIYTKENKKFWSGRLSLKLRKEKNNTSKVAESFEGTVACYVSHFKVLINLYLMNITKENNKENIFLVLEDDCLFGKKTIQLLKSNIFTSLIPNQWSILKPTWGKKSKQDKINDIFYNVTQARNRTWNYYFGNHFMLYNPTKIYSILWQIAKNEVNDMDVIMTKNVNHIYAFDDENIKQNKQSISDRDPTNSRNK